MNNWKLVCTLVGLVGLTAPTHGQALFGIAPPPVEHKIAPEDASKARKAERLEGRELEVVRAFLRSLERDLRVNYLPRFPQVASAVGETFATYDSDTRMAGPLVRSRRGATRRSAWRLEPTLRDPLLDDLETIASHTRSAPEMELIAQRLKEIVDYLKIDAYFAEEEHFSTAFQDLRVRLEELHNLVVRGGERLGAWSEADDSQS